MLWIFCLYQQCNSCLQKQTQKDSSTCWFRDAKGVLHHVHKKLENFLDQRFRYIHFRWTSLLLTIPFQLVSDLHTSSKPFCSYKGRPHRLFPLQYNVQSPKCFPAWHNYSMQQTTEHSGVYSKGTSPSIMNFDSTSSQVPFVHSNLASYSVNDGR